MNVLASALAGSGTLTRLDLTSCGLQAEGVTTLMARLPACTSLCTLSLAKNNFGDQGASVIAKALPQMALCSLDTGHNSIRQSGATLIARACAKATVLAIRPHLTSSQ
jgi:Ran GTPase-activating protein (RanGAP) involved in mRNA processing and transport